MLVADQLTYNQQGRALEWTTRSSAATATASAPPSPTDAEAGVRVRRW